MILTSSHVLYGQQAFKTTQQSVIGYLEYLPQEYALNSEKYPIVIFLHGIGERGYNSTDPDVLSQTISRVSKHGPPMFVKNGTQFPFILISPQLKDNYGNWPSEYVMEVINHVKTYLRIDEKRIYLTGLSLGGGGAWWTAQDYPELFAALAPVCGGRNSTALACNIAAENLPVWAFHGDKDTVVPLSRSVSMVNAINGCVPKPAPEAIMTIYPGVGHDAWSNAYRIDNTLHTPNVYDWMMGYTNTINGGNRIPTADAGADKNLSGTNISLTGNGYDADGSVSSYLWKQLSGPSVASMGNVTTRTLYASSLVPGQYVFSFRVTDDRGGSDNDYIRVTVSNNNLAPVANAGVNKTINLPLASVDIVGSGTDADGTIVAYSWGQVSGPSVSLSGVNSSKLTVSNLVVGSYVYRLTVLDDKGTKATDDMALYVEEPVAPQPAPAPEPVAPVADAGPNKLIVLPVSSVSIPGAGTDDDGGTLSYEWIKRSGPSCTITNDKTSSLNLTGLVSGPYVFRLVVTDNSGLTDYDDMLLTVTLPPVADAGQDKSVDLPVQSLVLGGSASDPDGSIKFVVWSRVSGPAVTMTNREDLAVTLTDLREGTYVFMLKAVDNLLVQTCDYVTVTVKAPLQSVTSSSTTAKSVVVKPVDGGQVATTESNPSLPVLGSRTSSDLENCLVAIFNATGDRIFSGRWTKESYKEIFTQSGLYVFNVMKEGKRIDAGKIYIRE